MVRAQSANWAVTSNAHCVAGTPATLELMLEGREGSCQWGHLVVVQVDVVPCRKT